MGAAADEGAGRRPGSISRLVAEGRSRSAAAGIMPLDYLLAILRDEREEERARIDAAEAAAPCCHARVASMELSGPNGGPIQTADVTDDMRAKALAAFIARTRANAASEQ